MKWPAGTRLVVVGDDPKNPAGEVGDSSWLGTLVTVCEDQEDAANSYPGTLRVEGSWRRDVWRFYVMEHDLQLLPDTHDIHAVEAFLNA